MDAEVPNSLKYLLLFFSIIMIGALGYFVYVESITTYDSGEVTSVYHRANPLVPVETLNSSN